MNIPTTDLIICGASLLAIIVVAIIAFLWSVKDDDAQGPS